MNILITGKSGIGKTTLCQELINSLKKNNINYGGVLCPGNDAVDLMTNEKKLFLDKEGIKPSKTCNKFINEEGMSFAVKAVKNAIDKCDFIVIDEYGPLELRREGLAEVMDDAIKSGKDILIVVRDKLKDHFLEKYSDFKFEVFDIDKEEDLAKAREMVKNFRFQNL
jgi:nucleoside-triphosphatase